jgi:hypothetical protein
LASAAISQASESSPVELTTCIRIASWVAASKYTGQVVENGQQCDEFQLQSGSYLLVMDVVANTNVPVRYATYQGNSLLISYSFGSDITPGVDASKFQLPLACTINNGNGITCMWLSRHVRCIATALC